MHWMSVKLADTFQIREQIQGCARFILWKKK